MISPDQQQRIAKGNHNTVAQPKKEIMNLGFDDVDIDKANTGKKWYNDDNDDRDKVMGIGRGHMHGSIINHLRDSPLKQTIQQRIVQKHQNYGYDEMIREEEDETDGESIKLRRSSGKSLNDTGKSSNLRLTGKQSQQQRIDNIRGSTWHRKFQDYKN
jgi:hypothetical protein